MNQFVYLINNRTGCKVKCVNPAFQSKLNSLIVQLEKILVQLKNNGISPSLDNKLRNVLKQVLVLLNGNGNQLSRSTPRSDSHKVGLLAIITALILLIKKLKSLNSPGVGSSGGTDAAVVAVAAAAAVIACAGLCG